LGLAQTGSGKTLAYALPLVQKMQLGPHRVPRLVRALVLVPTRELAVQVNEVLASVVRSLPQALKIAAAFGGVSINPQMMALRGGADIVVATPGRLLDLVRHNALRLGHVNLLVLDEADRLLDMGFAEELADVLALLPEQRQNLFFSATFPAAVHALANQLLKDPVRITIDATNTTEPDIQQRAIRVDDKKRTTVLRHLIQDQGWKRVLVFVATKYDSERLADKLYKAGIFATAFHGDLSQGARKEVLAEFKDERWEVVVTTDLAARGIDIAKLPVVVNYDLPRSAVDYTHRIGRTGRAGESGVAVSLVTAQSLAHWKLIAKRHSLTLELEELPGFEPTEEAVVPLLVDTSGNGGIKGKRPSKKDKLRAAAALAASTQGSPQSGTN
jgi:superfamily II DNA/RNA helicase